jgi:hypothetical protein
MPDKREHRGPHPSDAKLFILDACMGWANLAAEIVTCRLPSAQVITLD